MSEYPAPTLPQLMAMGVASAYIENLNRFWGMPDRNIEEQWRDARLITEIFMPRYTTIREESVPLGEVEYGP